MDKTHTGRCMCGAVQYEVKPPFAGIISCHCKDCKRLHGNYNPLLIAEKANFKFIKGENNITWYNSSETSERGFCKTCGSQMFKRDKTGPKMKISAGNLDDTSGLKNVKNVWTKEASGFYVVPPGEQT